MITALTWGGAETQTVAIALRQKARGHDVIVVSMTRPEAFVDELQNAGVQVRNLAMAKSIPSIGALVALARIYKKWQPDLVHTQMFHAAILGRVARILVQVPRLISTLHTIRDRQSWAPLALRLTDRWCDHTTGVSQAVVDRYVSVGAVPTAKMTCIYNGIDTNRFLFDTNDRDRVRKELGLMPNDYFWLSAGRMVDAKDYPNLIRAIAELQSIKQNKNFCLVLAGEGPLKPALEAQVVAAGLQKTIRLLGLRPDLPALMSAADGYVLSSAWEGFGLVLAEALSSGLPVVATDCGGTRDILDSGLFGKLVPVGDAIALAKAMAQTMAQPPTDRSNSSGRESITIRFSFDTTLARWDKLYSPLQKIAFVVTRGDSIGGAQIHVRDLSRALKAKEIEVRVFVGSPGDLTMQLDQSGIRWQLVPGLVRSINPINDLFAIVRLFCFLRRFRPNLVSTHTAKSGLVGRWAAWIARIPAIFTAHGWQFADGISPLQKLVVLGIERFSAPISRRIVTVSQYDFDLAVKNRIAPTARLRLVHNGMPDRPALLRAPVDSSSSCKLIMVARFQEQKDHECLFRALSTITNRVWALDLVGDGPLLEKTRSLAHILGISERINFLGQRLDVPELLERADIFVLASKWEGFPRSILEAMRASLPVIASDVGGVRESVVHSETGIVVPPGSIEQMQLAINSLLTNPVLGISMGRAGRERFENNFTFEAMFRKTWQVYEESL